MSYNIYRRAVVKNNPTHLVATLGSSVNNVIGYGSSQVVISLEKASGVLTHSQRGVMPVSEGVDPVDMFVLVYLSELREDWVCSGISKRTLAALNMLTPLGDSDFRTGRRDRGWFANFSFSAVGIAAHYDDNGVFTVSPPNFTEQGRATLDAVRKALAV